MNPNRGSRRWLPRSRRTAVDIAVAALKVPSFPIYRSFSLAVPESARRACTQRIGWAALLMHAYGRVAMEFEALRDVYVRYPVPYVYRHPEAVGAITIHRQDEFGEERLAWGRLVQPGLAPLNQVQNAIARFTTEPIASFYRDGLRMEKLPGPLRSLQWWGLMRWSGRKRAKHLGTFSISNLGGWGVLNAKHPLVTTTSLAMGPIDESGKCDVALICDHRVLDGVLAARALCRLEEVLNHESVQALRELRATVGVNAAA